LSDSGKRIHNTIWTGRETMANRRNKRKKTRWESDLDFDRRTKRQTVRRVGFMMPSIGRGPLMRMQKVTMRYQGGVALSPGFSGVTATHVFTANGMFDPDNTGVGHQPRGFDQLMVLYDHYVVIATKITVDFIPSSGTSVNGEVGVALRDSNSVDDSNDYIEGGNCMYSYMSGNGGYQTRLVYQVNPNKFLGRSKPLADPDCKGSSSTNPAELAFFHVFATNPVGGEVLQPVCACVLIEYTAILIEPRVPTQS